ncbi:MAG TPA: type II toxin-antitoxin system VapC family toxin [Kiritimatiellia bacterium]|nr:type II toxin-antitoxin system VapC family toxin [Kiritimatiellia bacterium]
MNDKELFFDTSYLARLYVEDAGFLEIRRLTDAVNRIALAWHAHTELVSALHRAYRDSRLDRDAFRAAVDQFEQDSAQGLFRWIVPESHLLHRIESVYLDAPAALFLRAADALHLACAEAGGFSSIYSNDTRLLSAAPLFGLEGRNIIQ